MLAQKQVSVALVDDDERLVAALVRELDDGLFKVSIARCTNEALEVIKEHQVDVLLTDLRMSGRDGIDLIKAVRVLSPKTRPILMSAYATAKDYKKAIELGAVEVLSKPFSPDELRAAIKKAVDCEEGFRGSLHGLALTDILQMFHFSRKSVTIRFGAKDASIHMQRGEIIHAEDKPHHGKSALISLLSNPSGTIRTGALEPVEQTIFDSFQSLVLDVLREIDESRVEISQPEVEEAHEAIFDEDEETDPIFASSETTSLESIDLELQVRALSGETMERAESMVGTMLPNNYHLERLLGMGALGAVFEARQRTENIDRRVAVKLLNPAKPHVVERFAQQIEGIRSLRHPNTATLLDFNQTRSGQPFVAMEYLEGISLQQLMAKNGPIHPVRCLKIIYQVLQSLSEAHSRGVVHGDIKPTNIMIGYMNGKRDFVKLFDFGIAHTFLERSDQHMSSPSFLSPEQLSQGEPISPESDLFSVGLLIYYCVRGMPAFVGNSAAELEQSFRLSQPPPLESPLGVEVSVALQKLVNRALDQQPNERFLSAEEFSLAIENCLSDYGHSTIGDILQPSPTTTTRNLKRITPTLARNSTRTKLYALIGGLSAIVLMLVVVLLARTAEVQKEPLVPKEQTLRASPARLAAPSVGGGTQLAASPIGEGKRVRIPVATPINEQIKARIVVRTTPSGLELLDATTGDKIGKSPATVRITADDLPLKIRARSGRRVSDPIIVLSRLESSDAQIINLDLTDWAKVRPVRYRRHRPRRRTESKKVKRIVIEPKRAPARKPAIGVLKTRRPEIGIVDEERSKTEIVDDRKSPKQKRPRIQTLN